jgi:hypothetical protein
VSALLPDPDTNCLCDNCLRDHLQRSVSAGVALIPLVNEVVAAAREVKYKTKRLRRALALLDKEQGS